MFQERKGEIEEFEFNIGVRLGDGLLTTLFNISLDALIKNYNLKGSITNREIQIVAYTDDLAVLARDRNSRKEMTLIEKEANKRGL